MNQQAPPLIDQSVWRGWSAPEETRPARKTRSSSRCSPVGRSARPWSRSQSGSSPSPVSGRGGSSPRTISESPASVLVTLPYAWLTLIPIFFFVVFLGSRRPAKDLAPPAGSRVAMAVTKAPSEPFAVVAQTLEAMLRQTFRTTPGWPTRTPPPKPWPGARRGG